MIVKLLTEHHLEFLRLKGGCRGLLSLHMSKYHIIGNHMHWLINVILVWTFRYGTSHCGECSGSVVETKYLTRDQKVPGSSLIRDTVLRLSQSMIF